MGKIQTFWILGPNLVLTGKDKLMIKDFGLLLTIINVIQSKLCLIYTAKDLSFNIKSINISI